MCCRFGAKTFFHNLSIWLDEDFGFGQTEAIATLVSYFVISVRRASVVLRGEGGQPKHEHMAHTASKTLVWGDRECKTNLQALLCVGDTHTHIELVTTPKFH